MHYLTVFRVAGTAAFMAYGLGHLSNGIWKGETWGATIKEVIDGLVYGLLTAGHLVGCGRGRDEIHSNSLVYSGEIGAQTPQISAQHAKLNRSDIWIVGEKRSVLWCAQPRTRIRGHTRLQVRRGVIHNIHRTTARD
jgi:hypothetical protein